MKLGVLLFGHLRTFEYSSQYFIENVVKKYDCDIFMHTWDEIDSTTQSWNNKINCDKKLDKITLEKVKTIYKPKSIIVGHQDNQNDEVIESIDGFKKVSVNGMNYMFESMQKANELRIAYEQEFGVKYDYLLVTRPDVAVYNFLDIPATIKEAQTLNIDIDNARFFAGLYGNSDTNVRLLCNRVNDILFFAKPAVVDRYISVNSFFNKHELDKTFLNVVSVYTRNEIKAGIQPIEICFECEKDWKNVSFQMLQAIKNNNTSNIVEFACSSDENYANYFLILLTSIMKKASKKKLYICHYFQDNLQETTLKKIKLLASKFSNLELNIYPLKDLGLPSGLNHHKRFSKASFARLKFPEFFKDKKKIIYLDVDAFACDDIAKLYKIDVEGYYLAACKCYGCLDFYNNNSTIKNVWPQLENKYRNIGVQEYFNNILKLDSAQNYFKSGSLIMNLEKMRQDNISQKCLAFIQEYEPVLPDQDALNKFCGSNYLLLDAQWNLSYFRAFMKKDIPTEEKNAYTHAKKHPAIVGVKDDVFTIRKQKILSSYYKELLKFIKKNTQKTDSTHTVINIIGIRFKFKKRINR